MVLRGTLMGRHVIEHKLGEGGAVTSHLALSRVGRAVAVEAPAPPSTGAAGTRPRPVLPRDRRPAHGWSHGAAET